MPNKHLIANAVIHTDFWLSWQEKIMGSRAAQQVLTPGRLALVTDATSGLQQLAVVCGRAPAQPRSPAKPAAAGEHSLLRVGAQIFDSGVFKA